MVATEKRSDAVIQAELTAAKSSLETAMRASDVASVMKVAARVKKLTAELNKGVSGDAIAVATAAKPLHAYLRTVTKNAAFTAAFKAGVKAIHITSNTDGSFSINTPAGRMGPKVGAFKDLDLNFFAIWAKMVRRLTEEGLIMSIPTKAPDASTSRNTSGVECSRVSDTGLLESLK